MTSSQSPSYWPQAVRELSQSDAVMAKIITHYPGETVKSRGDAFETLMRSITGQQISVKAASAIWGRLEELCKGEVIAPQIHQFTEDELRSIGYSRQKVSYLHSLAEFFLARQHLERDWAQMEDEEVIKDITQIKGIGRWTAEMFLMFHLLRPNVLPVGDLGVVNAIGKYYYEGRKPQLEEIHAVAENWQPWRSVASWYLWRALDDDPVEY